MQVQGFVLGIEGREGSEEAEEAGHDDIEESFPREFCGGIRVDYQEDERAWEHSVY